MTTALKSNIHACACPTCTYMYFFTDPFCCTCLLHLINFYSSSTTCLLLSGVGNDRFSYQPSFVSCSKDNETTSFCLLLEGQCAHATNTAIGPRFAIGVPSVKYILIAVYITTQHDRELRKGCQTICTDLLNVISLDNKCS